MKKCYVNFILVALSFLLSIDVVADEFVSTSDGLKYNLTYETWMINRTVCAVAGYEGDGGEIVIPATIEVDGTVYEVEGIGTYAFANNKTITKITLPASLKFIEYSAFDSCGNLTEVKALMTSPCSSPWLSWNREQISNATLVVPQTAVEQYINQEWKGFADILDVETGKSCLMTNTLTYNDKIFKPNTSKFL